MACLSAGQIFEIAVLKNSWPQECQNGIAVRLDAVQSQESIHWWCYTDDKEYEIFDDWYIHDAHLLQEIYH